MDNEIQKYSDPVNFKELMLDHQDRVLNIIFRFLNNKEDAEDVAQEVFVAVYQNLPTFQGNAQLSTWIHRIAVNKSMDFLRKRNRKKRLGQIKQIVGLNDIEEKFAAPTSSNPHLILKNKERARILKQAVDSLTKKQRTAIVLNKYEGFSYQEVAEIMQTTLSAVESLIHKGMKNLRKKLFNYCREIM